MSDGRKDKLIDTDVSPLSTGSNNDYAVGDSRHTSITHGQLAQTLANLSDEADAHKLMAMVCPETGLNVLQFAVLHGGADTTNKLMRIFGQDASKREKMACEMQADLGSSEYCQMPAVEIAIAAGKLPAFEAIASNMGQLSVDLLEMCLKHDAGAALIWLWKAKGLITPNE